MFNLKSNQEIKDIIMKQTTPIRNRVSSITLLHILVPTQKMPLRMIAHNKENNPYRIHNGNNDLLYEQSE